MITRFDLFCMIYYLLDLCYDDNNEEVLGEYLSDANPFIFDGEGSADSVIYNEFSKTNPEMIDLSESYDIAMRYIQNLNLGNCTNLALSMSQDEWDNALRKYLQDK